MQRRRDKLEDKLVNSKREYLDTQSSEGDEFQENPSLDDGDSISRIVYEDSELETLISFIRNLTSLEGLDDGDWSDEILEIITDFIEIPVASVLSIYFRGSVLTAELNFPSIPVHQLTYFIREPDEIFHSSDFHRRIIFGTNNDNVEASVQRITESLLAPIFFQMTTWPDSVKADFSEALHQFLMSVGMLRYKLHSLTILYLPQEDTDLEPDKDLVKRLEGVVVNWTREIRLTLMDLEQAPSQDLLTPIDEHNFWIYRYKNLSGLNHQLQHPSVNRIINILEQGDSTLLENLLSLTKEIKSGISEGKSNIMYLGILKEVSEELRNCQRPEEISCHVRRLLHLLRFIWLNSPFYSSKKRITNLFVLINNEIILILAEFIDLRKILVMRNTRWGMRILKRCIEVCREYEETYTEFAETWNWELEDSIIFRNIHTFIQRCRHVLEICHVSIDLARLDETADIPVPRFAGTKAQEHQRVCIKVEKLFHEHLRLVCHNWRKILDVLDATWYDVMLEFRMGVKDLEIIIENLINVVFKSMNTVEEALGNLHGFRMYMRRRFLQRHFGEIINTVWRMFAGDIHRVRQEVFEEDLEYPGSSPYYAGRALSLRLKSKRLVATLSLLQHLTINDEVNHQCITLLTAINDGILGLYHKWMDDIGDNPSSRLDRYLMRWSVDKPRLLESNLDFYVLNLCHEAHHWRYLGFQIPVSVEMIDDKWRMLQFVSESVFMLVLSYNRVIQALSEEEKSFFKNLLSSLNYKMAPGLRKITWNSEFIDSYIQACCMDVNNLREFLKNYKMAGQKIMKFCEEICDLRLVKFRPNYVYDIRKFNRDLIATRDETFGLMQKKYQGIIQCILVVYKGFRKVIEESAEEWRNYIGRLDKVFEEALRFSVKNSLTMIHEVLHGDETTEPSPVFRLEIDLIEKKIVFSPRLEEVSSKIVSMKNEILEPLRRFRRIGENFGMQEEKSIFDVFREDEGLREIQGMLDNEVHSCISQIKLYLKSWEPFADIWEVSKDLFIKRYEKLKPTVASFDADIARYSEVANSVQMQETVTTVHFLDINCDRLKAGVIQHCSQWQEKLTSLLLRMTQIAVDRLYKYMAENEEKMRKEPGNLGEMQKTCELFERLSEEIHLKEEEFPGLREQYQTLEKYEIGISFEFKRKMKGLGDAWREYCSRISSFEIRIEEYKEEFREWLFEKVAIFGEDSAKLRALFLENGPFTSEWRTLDALAWLKDFRFRMEELKRVEEELQRNLKIFDATLPKSSDLSAAEKDLMALEIVWELTRDWDDAWERYREGNFWTIEIEEMDVTANNLFRKLTKLSRELKSQNWGIVEDSRLRVDRFRRSLPLINDLKNPALRDRHWAHVKVLVDDDFDETSSSFTLSAILEMEMYNFGEQIGEISNAASMELSIELGLEKIASGWKYQELSMTPYKDYKTTQYSYLPSTVPFNDEISESCK